MKLTPYSQVVYETNRYSVPTEKARRELVLKAYPFRVEIIWEHEVIASHARCYGREQDIFLPPQLPGLAGTGGLEPLSTHDRCAPFDASGHRPTIVSYNGSKSNGQKDAGCKNLCASCAYSRSTRPSSLSKRWNKRWTMAACMPTGSSIACMRSSKPQLELPVLDLSKKPHLAELGTPPVQLRQYDQLVERVAYT